MITPNYLNDVPVERQSCPVYLIKLCALVMIQKMWIVNQIRAMYYTLKQLIILVVGMSPWPILQPKYFFMNLVSRSSRRHSMRHVLWWCSYLCPFSNSLQSGGMKQKGGKENYGVPTLGKRWNCEARDLLEIPSIATRWRCSTNRGYAFDWQ